jgi:DNA recombination protein RmuC
MESLLFFLIGAAVLAASFACFVALRNRQPARDEEALKRLFLEFQQEMNGLRTSVNEQIVGLSRHVNEQLSQNHQVLVQSQQGYREAVGQVQHRLGELQSATKSMMDIGKDISSLQNILRAPKLRGGMGELFLAELLRQILPEDHFVLQYGFRDGSKVDAVILLGQGIVPVDAKFPLENFKRILEATGDEDSKLARKEFIKDVKKHIDSISSKYILPEEGTFDFAIMYIPAENVYYETIIKDEMQPESLASYAQRKRVVPVSPNSFYAYLQAIVRGLKGLRIERSAQIILESLGQLDTDFKKCLEDFDKMGKHLSNAQSCYQTLEKRLGRLQDKLSTIENQQAKPLLPEALENPTAP